MTTSDTSRLVQEQLALENYRLERELQALKVYVADWKPIIDAFELMMETRVDEKLAQLERRLVETIDYIVETIDYKTNGLQDDIYDNRCRCGD